MKKEDKQLEVEEQYAITDLKKNDETNLNAGNNTNYEGTKNHH